MLPCVCSVKDHRWRQNVVRKKKWHKRRSWVCHWCPYHILTSSVIYYWTDARQHGIYLFYIITKSLFYLKISQNNAKAGLLPRLCTKKGHLTWSIVYTNEAISLVARRSKRIMIGPRKSRHCQTWLERRFSWHENLQRKQNWISAKSTKREENARKLSSEQPCEPKSLDACLEYRRSLKLRSEKLWLWSTLEVIQFEFGMKGAL